MPTKQHVPVFLSSTFVDMIPYREKAAKVLEDVQLAVNGMEIFGARPGLPLETCLEEVGKSIFYICLVGMRYGSIEPASGKSFTHLEYDKAMEMGLPSLIYLVDQHNVRLLLSEIDTESEKVKKLSDFKSLLQNRHTTASFSSPEDLAVKLKRDLLREFEKLGFVVDKGIVQPASVKGEIADLLRDFAKIPAKLRGREMQIKIRLLGEAERVDETRCRTLGLSPGASLKRRISVIDPAGASISEIYAGWDTCEFLLKKPVNTECSVVVRLLYERECRLEKPEPRLPGLFELNDPFARLDPGYSKRKREYDQVRPLETIEYVSAFELVELLDQCQPAVINEKTIAESSQVGVVPAKAVADNGAAEPAG
jgi:hypothetical protein